MARKPTTTDPRQEPPAEKQGEGRWTDQEMPLRRDLLLEAIRAIRTAIQSEKGLSGSAVGHLVQLLKLHKELVEEEDRPAKIQLIWNEVDEEYCDDD
jgi:hypothetical protein